jgi:CcmD family protein
VAFAKRRFAGFLEKGHGAFTALLAHEKVGGKMKNLDSLMAAYLAVWAIFFVYHFTVARRVARLQDEIARLKQTLKQ